MQLFCQMQLLLGDAAGPNLESSFVCGVFLQHLSSHVRMVLAPSGEMTLDSLAQLVDKVMKVVLPSVSAVSVAPLIPMLTNCTQRWDHYTISSLPYR